jgi:hypothetical protein
LHRRLPERIRGAGTLYLWLRKGRSTLRATRALRGAGREHEMVDSCLRVPLAENEVQLCTGELAAALGEVEAEETRALFMPGPRVPQLPDFIKLDCDLVHGVHLDPVKSVIAGKLIEIGRALGIGTIVEGIEEEAELAWVHDHGADYVQGFLLGQPQPVESI